MFSGSLVALVTPMKAKGEVDHSALQSLIERHIVAGTSAIVVNGTTGESPTLNRSERVAVIETAVQTAKGRLPIIAGTGTHSTALTIELTAEAKALGAAAALVVTPYYNKPTQEGLYQHYCAVANAVELPLLIYNVPGRTAVDISVETLERLSSIPMIVGVKEASGNLQKSAEFFKACPNLSFYSGDDASALAFMLQGGKGVISVTANVVPEAMAVMCGAALSRDINLAGEVNTKLMPLHKQLFVESNPIPVKWALQEMGWIKEGIRLPLTMLSEHYHQDVREAMKTAGVFECVAQ